MENFYRIKEIRASKKMKWISVKDELPKDYKFVLCLGNEGEFFLAFRRDNKWIIPYYDKNYTYYVLEMDEEIQKVEYWHLIPLPPRGDLMKNLPYIR